MLAGAMVPKKREEGRDKAHRCRIENFFKGERTHSKATHMYVCMYVRIYMHDRMMMMMMMMMVGCCAGMAAGLTRSLTHPTRSLAHVYTHSSSALGRVPADDDVVIVIVIVVVVSYMYAMRNVKPAVDSCRWWDDDLQSSATHTHTYTYIYISLSRLSQCCQPAKRKKNENQKAKSKNQKREQLDDSS